MKIQYLLLRLIRHYMPEDLARFLLKMRWIIRPGLESSDPLAAVDQYIKVLSSNGKNLSNKRVLVFGYGGRFAVGAELLKQGASHIVLCDHHVLLDRERNLKLLPIYGDYLVLQDGEAKPKPEYITLLHGDIREESIRSQIPEVDFVLSTSVFEHLDDVDGITNAIAKLTSSEGCQVHFVDLRDHYFKQPFEMLTFSERVWRDFLNPTSNLNRFRVPAYNNIFKKYFKKVTILVLARQEDEFSKTVPRILPEFLTGDLQVDSTTLILIFAESPANRS